MIPPPLIGAIAGGVVFSPSQIASLGLWLDALAITGLSVSDPIITWFDSSPAGRDATQANSAYRPTYEIVNGMPVVRMDGTDDHLGFTDFSAGSKTVFAVCRPLVAVGSLTQYATVIACEGANLRYRVSGSEWGMYLDNNTDLGAGEALPTTEFSILTIQSNVAAPSSFIRRNGVQKASSPDQPAFVAQNPEIGADTAFNRYANAEIAELIICSSVLTAGEITSVENYLAGKWGPLL